MKPNKIIFALTALLSGSASFAQNSDFSIGSQMLPASCLLGDTVIYQVQIANLGHDAYPAHALIATISAPGDGKIIGFTDEGALAGWEITHMTTGSYANQGGNTVTLRNTIPLEGETETLPSFKVVAVNLGSAVGNQTSEVVAKNVFESFGYVNDVDPNNNTSGTSLAVTAPLPLTFTDINAAWKNEDGIVKWTVAREVANDYFKVERSFDGKDFEAVGEVKSIGDHEGKQSYTYTDVNVKPKTASKVFYRIKQVDINGSSSLSSVTSLSVDAANADAYIFPNPATGSHFSFVYQDVNTKDMDLDIQILDAHGRVLQQTKKAVTKGKNQIEFSTDAMAAGTYFLNYTNTENQVKGTIRFAKD